MKLRGVNCRKVLSIYFTFWLGLLGGGVIDYFRGFSEPSTPASVPIPDYGLFLKVIEVNFTFSLVIFLLDMNTVIQRIAILIISFVMGEIAFTFGFFIGLIGTLPHGVLEILGFSLVAYAGQNFRSKNNYIVPLLMGYLSLTVAAFIESSLTIYVLQHVLAQHSLCLNTILTQ
ncbi:hypothetical protein [Sulfuracidifex tepidarius]|uniref:Stage II sporulation protein M n=1 Tax=Sulfuracidifex tepidarius TaxID=1294262 RepID=A0A510E5Z9_9CREN|nr:hypothetical protein [Sulfuracidifex tepidarius]BBG25142.1 hypothetical protein IC006_2477 [Sulfuracidifex tepidarius]BBG27929.1 hypothetical protein IC007_2484 [Sulfuracidifex tepidarius]